MAQDVEITYVHVGNSPFKDFLELSFNFLHGRRGTTVV